MNTHGKCSVKLNFYKQKRGSETIAEKFPEMVKITTSSLKKFNEPMLTFTLLVKKQGF